MSLEPAAPVPARMLSGAAWIGAATCDGRALGAAVVQKKVPP